MINKKFLWLSLAAATALSVSPVIADTKMEELEKRMERLEKGHDGGMRHIHTPLGKGAVSVTGVGNRAVGWTTNTDQSRFSSFGNDNDPSRINLDADHRFGCYKIGAEFEIAVTDNHSSNTAGSLNTYNNDAGLGLDARKIDGRFVSDWATFKMGKGNMVSEDTSELDLSGTGVAAYGSSVNWMAGNVTFNNGTTVNSAWDPYDGFGQQNRVSLETNEAMAFGFKVGVGHATRERSDVALKYGGEYSGFKVNAAVSGLNSANGIAPVAGLFGAADDAEGTQSKYGKFRQVNGSFSVLHDSGVSVTAAGAHRKYRDTVIGDPVTNDPYMWFVKLGYKTNKVVEFGSSRFSINYGENRHRLLNKDKTKTYGVALVQAIDVAATELYVTAQAFDHKLPTGISPKKVYTFLTGAKVKF